MRRVVHSKAQTISKDRTEIISAFKRNGSKIKSFRKHERSDVIEAPLN